jgi:hypothetical protein
MRQGYRPRTTAGDKTICLPFPEGDEYERLMADGVAYRQYLDQQIAQHPELFPAEIVKGYWFHGVIVSEKQGLKQRRILLKANRQAYQIRPASMMPYMVGPSEFVEKGLYLRERGMSYDAIAHVLGRSPTYWYELTQSLSRISVVGVTVKDPSRLPLHLSADEKVTWWRKVQVYVAVTAAQGCILGSVLSRHADTVSLAAAYGEFQREAQATCPDYQPESVNVDGWDATQNAWQQLFPGIIIMRCFLHVVLGIQSRCRSAPTLLDDLTTDLWHLFHSLNPAQFGQRLRRLLEWALHPDLEMLDSVRQKLLKLRTLAPNFKQTFAHPEAARTSNAVDRVMNYQDRVLYSMQYFHGTEAAAQKALRAMALLWNFHLYIPKVRARSPNHTSAFEGLNGFRYHDHWLKNLLIAASLNGRNHGDFVSHKIA